MSQASTSPAGAGQATIIDGKAFAEKLRGGVARQVDALKARHGITPGLAVVLVGEDAASQVYVRSKSKKTTEVGMQSFQHTLPVETGEDELLDLVRRLNSDPQVHGILVQLPLPKHIDSEKVIDTIDPAKDVDGFHVVNAGRIATGALDRAMIPCTPRGCQMLLQDQLGDMSGKRAVIVGRSNIVGKPMAQLLLAENCTVTIAHSRTRDIAAECRDADIVVAAVGKPEFVRGDWIKPGATVIDVGINRLEPEEPGGKGRLVGDVAFDEAKQVAGAITPVPGGVGPMTIAVLLANTVTAACRQAGVEEPAR
ncbi:bifunctional methylenetetrahydrofolate dehydrogenase/methenyltetrahydrofolate cyclohydrolase FolD [Ferruginivarius sediminum]|uniref:Bifunctional protein FolD n=1 Tax=Ferruginivarius sediminum TaxID=2661937 RepID=A0A369T5G1_9PROT|nr:bifunctional methylenetetrahydrofolate dehydrogenase/methenyltetrahydrofolate cyclohydrolase FolD [Ferruginivarius sediminum]RDD60152.1 bifunctional methylenetetrahydrofolate dehydrogenase/methenyltetrahydrofolate cyclohydrolase FolD [Ferruginivarius sediminum]